MKCPICKKNTLFWKTIKNAQICKQCYTQLPILCKNVDLKQAIELLNYHGQKKIFHPTCCFRALALDEENFLFTIGEKIKNKVPETEYIYELRHVKDYDIKFIAAKKDENRKLFQKGKKIQGNIWFRVNLLYPRIEIKYKLMPFCVKSEELLEGEPNFLPASILDIKYSIEMMFDKFITQRTKRIKDTEQAIRLGKINEPSLEEAEYAFFLSDNYTKAEVRKQMHYFSKEMHPDVGGTTEYAQAINQLYNVLIENIKGRN